ncbi:AAA family ATPase [Kribbella sp. VKM Ac-2568]|uniref:AAA family ATPase n=1 Tax=Kribbella sp. VKM Ac-2568 TaxID=2512219 RepID=UPI001053750C|nr:ATP-binding protein [Kribbella sp. VKM Ac-2568]
MRPELGLLERDQAIAQLLAAAGQDESSVALITGEAGIGKTSVVRALLDQLPPGVRTFAGACDDLLAPPALAPIREAFRGSGSAAAEALASGAMDAVFEAVTAELTGSQLQLLVIEDVHWADDVTIDVLRYLVRRLDRIACCSCSPTARTRSTPGRPCGHSWESCAATGSSASSSRRSHSQRWPPSRPGPPTTRKSCTR